ncbi:MAG: prolyl oligopeptidase family serine peptidase [Armatimonadetes bacterium]|nr:prolyl oligopeptidase family serine peptidase [Armatimonadota bacterium]
MNYPLLLLKIEKVKLLLKRESAWYSTTDSTEREIKEGEALTKLIASNRLAYENATGFQERAYFSEVDDSPQPYFVYLPKAYYDSPTKPYPLMVFLHGYDTSTTKVNAWTLSSNVLDLCDRKGYVVAIPYGRRNTDFVSIGEVDVMTVIGEMKKHFRLDPDRIYLMGVSMGGYGAYAVSEHYPDVFAAVSVVAGRTDHYFWQKLDRQKVAPFKQWLIDGDNPISLVDNLRNLPLYLTQGEHDSLVDITHSRRMVETLKKLSFTFKFDEIKDENHWIYFDNACYEASLDWFDKYRRDLFPRLITYTTYSPKYGRAYWVEIKELKEWGKPADIRAEVKTNNVIEVKTKNVAALSVEFPKSLLDPARPVVLQWNNEKVFGGSWQSQAGWESPLNSPPGPQKVNGRYGPIKEAFNEPFLLVYGTQGGDRTKVTLSAKAQKMEEEWRRFADGSPTVKTDAQVTETDLVQRNLILFGDASQNLVVARLQKQLPIEFKEGEYHVNGQTYRGEDLGFMMLFPNPLNPKRYVVVQTGVYWGDSLPINHKFDLLPDFLVYNNRTDTSDYTNKYVCAGFFNNNWQVDKNLIWTNGQ